jgi:hypothetical protein
MTVDEVNALIPELTMIFQRLIALRREIIARAHELERLGHDPTSRRRRDLPSDIMERRERLEAAVVELEREVDRVGTLGGILSDLDLGIVDFHHDLDGAEVFLSWQFGEAAVTHFRPAGSGFASRVPLPDAPPPEPPH